MLILINSEPLIRTVFLNYALGSTANLKQKIINGAPGLTALLKQANILLNNIPMMYFQLKSYILLSKIIL